MGSFSSISFSANDYIGNMYTLVDVDAYYLDAWHDVFEGDYIAPLQVCPIGSIQDIEKIRIRFFWEDTYPTHQTFNYNDLLKDIYLTPSITRPISHVDVDSVWIDEEMAYNEVESVFAKPYIVSGTWGGFLELYMPETVSVTTQAATQIDYQCAIGNGIITSGTNASERGFEIVVSFSGTLADYFNHLIAGFIGDSTWDIVFKWNGTLTKTETETGDFAEGAYELVLGYPSASYDVYGTPDYAFDDKLFKCESYTYRAYAVINSVTYYGSYVAFSTLCDSGSDQQSDDDISDGDPVVPIIPIEPEPDIPPFPPWEPDDPDPYPPWDWEPPEWTIPDYPSPDWTFDFYYRKPYTKKDLDELRKKCIIYNKNSIEFALVLRHNMNVLKEFFNMMTDYMSAEEYNDFTDLIPPQNLKALYLDPLEPTDFRDMINGFIRNTVDNNIAVNRNFKLIQDGLSDYETESDDACFREITTSMKPLNQDDPDVERMKRLVDNLNYEVAANFNEIMRNLKIIRAKLL